MNKFETYEMKRIKNDEKYQMIYDEYCELLRKRRELNPNQTGVVFGVDFHIIESKKRMVRCAEVGYRLAIARFENQSGKEGNE
jgi:hypothetical protein